jgi:hypothetical protein
MKKALLLVKDHLADLFQFVCLRMLPDVNHKTRTDRSILYNDLKFHHYKIQVSQQASDRDKDMCWQLCYQFPEMVIFNPYMPDSILYACC